MDEAASKKEAPTLAGLTPVLNTPVFNKPGTPPPPDTEDPIHTLRKLGRQIQILDYDPVLFESMLEDYDLNVGPLDKPLEEVPLYMNDEDPVAIAIVKWRLENAV
jgi:hypothetical protein